jgi:hypothetical protein
VQKMPTCAPSSASSYTVKRHKHVACGFGLVTVKSCCPGKTEIGTPLIYRGQDCIKRFLQEVIEIAKERKQRLEAGRELQMNGWDQADFRRSTRCYACGKQRPLVRDHCHLCQRYRGAACSDCNLKLRCNDTLVVGFHNLRKYDGHLIMQELGAAATEEGLKIDVVAKGIEDYISFTLYKKDFRIRFIDTLQFLPGSLDSLVSNCKNFPLMASNFQGEQLQLLLRKGIYPYEYMVS